MTLDRLRQNSMKKLRLLPAIVVMSSLGHASVQIELRSTATLADVGEAGRIVAKIRVLALRPAQDPWEKDILRAGERSFGDVVATPIGTLVGMTTVQSDEGDVLVANWHNAGSADLGIRQIWMWDTPEHNWFVIKADAAAFASASSAERSLHHVLKWNFMLPSLLQVDARYTSSPGPAFLTGQALLPSADLGREYSLAGIWDNSEAYLVIRVGKAMFLRLYPEGGAYVPERFPPLKEVVRSWSKEQILSEVGKTWRLRGPIANHYTRDAILISAAADRGLAAIDLYALLLSMDAPGPTAWEQRTWLVMRSLAQSRQLEHNRNAIEDITLRLARMESSGPLTLQAVFSVLRDSSDSDYGELALRCLATGIYADAPLKYLMERAGSEDAYVRVKQAVVPQASRALQRAVLGRIRIRINAVR